MKIVSGRKMKLMNRKKRNAVKRIFNRGFSALEVTMVASVIAILALIALPVYLDRVEDARQKAAIDEMSQIGKAQQIAKADTSFYFRLQDLDNTIAFNGTTPSAPEIQGEIHVNVPSYYWNQEITDSAARTRLSNQWKGPYIVYQRLNTIQYGNTGFGGTAYGDTNLREIFSDFDGPVPTGGPSVENFDDELPLDPWGSPYIFFGTGAQIDVAGLNEESFFNAVIYSLGPDGLPGDGQAFNSGNLYREDTDGGGPQPYLGTGDDLVYKVQ